METMQKEMVTIRRLVVMTLFCLFFAACELSESTDDDDDDDTNQNGTGLTVKFINLGTIGVTGFYTVPAGQYSEAEWMSADWGENLLVVTPLEQLEFVLMDDFERADLDCIATFDPQALVEPLKWNVPAYWISDAEYLTISVGRGSDGSWSSGHQFGNDTYTGETDVTPP